MLPAKEASLYPDYLIHTIKNELSEQEGFKIKCGELSLNYPTRFYKYTNLFKEQDNHHLFKYFIVVTLLLRMHQMKEIGTGFLFLEDKMEQIMLFFIMEMVAQMLHF